MNEEVPAAISRLLDLLLKARGRPVDLLRLRGEADTKDFEAAMRQLVAGGCQLERDPATVRLVRSGLGLWKQYLEHVLCDGPWRRIEIYPTTTSTQALIKARPAEALLVLADEQTAGCGRLGRRWVCPAGTGVLLSLTHQLDLDQPFTIDRLSFLTAVAVAEAIERIIGTTELIQIRWPNDLMVDGAKLAGILVEIIQPSGTAVIGVGINVDLDHQHLIQLPPSLRDQVCSFRLCGWPADRLHVASEIILSIDQHLQADDVEPAITQWRRRNLLNQEMVSLRSEGQTITGTVIDLDPDEGLIVRRQSGEIVHLHASTTSLL